MKPELFAQAIAEFQEIYKQEHNVELSTNEAAEKATAILQLFDVLTSREGGMIP